MVWERGWRNIMFISSSLSQCRAGLRSPAESARAEEEKAIGFVNGSQSALGDSAGKFSRDPHTKRLQTLGENAAA